MSRSIRTRSSSRRSRPISDAWSAGLGPTRRAGAACCWVGVGAGAPLPAAGRPSAQRSQARTSRSGRPNSAATAETERPPRIAATASSLNASGKNRRCLLLSAIDTSQAVKPIWGVRGSGAGPDGLYDGGQVQEAACWAHVRRYFFELHATGQAPLATEAVRRIGLLYAIEQDIRGRPADERARQRKARAGPVLESLRAWLDDSLARVSGRSDLAV